MDWRNLNKLVLLLQEIPYKEKLPFNDVMTSRVFCPIDPVEPNILIFFMTRTKQKRLVMQKNNYRVYLKYRRDQVK